MLEDTKGRTKSNMKRRLKIPKTTKLKFQIYCVILNEYAYEQIAPIIFILNKVLILYLMRSFFRSSDELSGNQ